MIGRPIMEPGVHSTSNLVELLCATVFFMYMCRGMGRVVWSHAGGRAVSPSIDLTAARPDLVEPLLSAPAHGTSGALVAVRLLHMRAWCT